MTGQYIFKFATKKAGCKGPDPYKGDVIWDESDGPTHLKFWSGKEYERLSYMVRNEVDKYMKLNNPIERPTPETALAKYRVNGVDIVWPDFAERLERERDKAREDATNYYAKIGELEQERDNAIADRDILRIDAQREAEHHDRMVGELERVYKERNEARDKYNQICSQTLIEVNKAHEERDDALSQIVQAECRAERFCQERDNLREAIIATLEENRHLADGDDCTLAKLKSVVPEWK